MKVHPHFFHAIKVRIIRNTGASQKQIPEPRRKPVDISSIPKAARE
ncbi:hypothetical protein [Methanospirillum hungatei]|nr:hypothetical protein [Methanospirillum hungatei]MCA1915457.1 hypothetical protein [Methanospirillum hungatei]